jgi:UDP-N-acetylglucosamine 1-carboxyvinyltransferase
MARFIKVTLTHNTATIGAPSMTALMPAGLPSCPDVLWVGGEQMLRGTVEVEGCKLSSITMIISALLTDEPVVLEQVPVMLDHEILCDCLRRLGADVQRTGSTLRLHCRHLEPVVELPDAIIESVHGTTYLLPALLMRYGRVRLRRSRGGCNIGVRPIAHIAAVLRAFGAKVRLGDVIEASLPARGLVGCHIGLNYGAGNNKFISGATKTAILAGVLARGETEIENAYWRQPIVDLCRLLRAMGAQIEGEGSRRIRIRGVASLRAAKHRVSCDRLAMGTYIAAAAGGNEIHCRQASLEAMQVEADAFRRMGIELEQHGEDVIAAGTRRLVAASLSTETLDTDLGPIFVVLMTLADGSSRLEDVVWERRFRYAAGLRRMGGHSVVRRRTIEVTGVPSLTGASVKARDLRSAAALLLAALKARGPSRIQGAAHLARGYEDLPGRLNSIGADIRSVPGGAS